VDHRASPFLKIEMGCAAVKGPPAPQTKATLEETVSDPPATTPQIQLWATTTESKNAVSLSTASTSPSSARPSEQKSDESLVLKDADDNDIEVICEAAAQIICESATADSCQEAMIDLSLADGTVENSPKAPAALSVEARRKKESEEFEARIKREHAELKARQKKEQEEQQAALLKQQQQEQADKLAERRKAFEEKYSGRYQPEGAGPMVMGLNQDHNSNDAFSHVQILNEALVDLPGGIFDEVEPFQKPVQYTSKNNHHKHDDLDFNADDELLMQEILEDCND